MPETSADISRQRHDAIASLLLGLFSFAALPASFAIWKFEVELPTSAATALYVTAFVVSLAAGVLALVFGSRAHKTLRRIKERTFSRFIPTSGMVLGVVGVVLGYLVIDSQIATMRFRYSFHPYPYAIGSLRTINTAAVVYFCRYGHGFPLKLSYLAPPKSEATSDLAAGFIDDILAAGTKSGYRFYYVAGPVDSQGRILTYTVHADPLEKWPEASHYFMDQSGVIRQQSKRQASINSPLIEGENGGSGWGWGTDGAVDCREVLKFYPSPP
jgi:hypothetical protein